MAARIVIETIKQVRGILSEEGLSDAGLMQIADKMRTLVARSNEVLPSEIFEKHEPGLKSIYADASGLLLTYGIVAPERPTPIHSHGTWGVVGVYRGRDRYQIWRRQDNGHGPGPAEVKLAAEMILGPGDAVVIPPPPQDIHLQQGYAGEVAHEFVLFGDNILGRLPYLIFDPERGYADEACLGVSANKDAGSTKGAASHR